MTQIWIKVTYIHTQNNACPNEVHFLRNLPVSAIFGIPLPFCPSNNSTPITNLTHTNFALLLWSPVRDNYIYHPLQHSRTSHSVSIVKCVARYTQGTAISQNHVNRLDFLKGMPSFGVVYTEYMNIKLSISDVKC